MALIVDLARRQHGVVGRGQLFEAGLSRTVIDSRVTSGLLILVFRAVYAMGAGILTPRGMWKAATLTGRGESILSHSSAAALHGLMPPQLGSVEIIRPDGRSGRLRAGPGADGSGAGPRLLIHRTRDLPAHEVTEVDGIPVTTVSRTSLDMSPRISLPRMRSFLAEGDRRRSVRQEELQAAASRGRGWTDIEQFREVAHDLDPDDARTESDLEILFRQFCREHGIPLPRVNRPKGQRRIDCIWEEARLIVEVDGFAFHRSRHSFEEDRRRDALHQAQGYRTMRVTKRAMTERSGETARILKALHADSPRTIDSAKNPERAELGS